MHDVAAHISHERLAAIFRGPRVAAVDSDSRRAGEVTGGPSTTFDRSWHGARNAQPGSHDAPRFDRADAKDLGLRSVSGDAHARSRSGQIRVSCDVTVFIHRQLNVIAVRR